jgi:hypothetical protein
VCEFSPLAEEGLRPEILYEGNSLIIIFHGDRFHVKIPAEEIIMLNFNNSNIVKTLNALLMRDSGINRVKFNSIFCNDVENGIFSFQFCCGANIDDYCPGDDITKEVVEKLDNLGRSKQFEKALKLLSK